MIDNKPMQHVEIKFFILEDENSSLSLDNLQSELIKQNYVYDLGKMGARKKYAPFFMCIYEDGNAERINRHLSPIEISRLLKMPDEYKTVIDFLHLQ